MRNILSYKRTYAFAGAVIGAVALIDSIKFRASIDVINPEGIIAHLHAPCKDAEILFGKDKPDTYPKGEGQATAELRLVRWPRFSDLRGVRADERPLKVNLTECESPEGDGNPARRR